MSQAQRTAPSALTGDALLAEMARLYREIRTAPRAQRRAIEAQIRTYADRHKQLEEAMNTASLAPIPISEQCALCRCRLTTGYSIALGLCGSCADRPEAKRLPRDPTGRVVARLQAVPEKAPPPAPPPAFTAAEQSLIKHMHGYVPASELLKLLNDRLVAHLGSTAVPHTLAQLHAAVQGVADPAQADDWGQLRQVLAAARTAGVLAAITPQIVEDFAVCYQLTPAQVLHLKDVLEHAQEQR